MTGSETSGMSRRKPKVTPVQPHWTPAERPAWLEDMHAERGEVHGMNGKGQTSVMQPHHLPEIVVYPGSSEQVDNYSVLDLDLTDPGDLKRNFDMVIAHHRQWVRANSEIGFLWDGTELNQSWVCPPSGTYLHYVRYKGRLLCLVGDGPRSWLTGVLTENVAAEFHKDDAEPKDSYSKKKKVTSRSMPGDYIITTPGVEKMDLPGKGNYSGAEGTQLGPRQLKRAFDTIWSVLGGSGKPIAGAFDCFIIHLWDSARNDDIRELTSSAFSEDKEATGVCIESEHSLMMKNWKSMSQRAMKSVVTADNLKVKDKLSWLGNARDVMKTLRILHCPGIGPAAKGSFHMKDLPLPLSNGGRPLKIPMDLPSYLITPYSKITKLQNTIAKEGVSSNLALKGNTANKAGIAIMSEEENAKKRGSTTNEDNAKKRGIIVSTSEDNAKREFTKSAGANLRSDKIVTKYMDAARVVNDAMGFAVSSCKPNARIADVCQKTDYVMTQESSKIYKKHEKGVSFPTTMLSGIHSFPGKKEIMEENDLVKIHMGYQIDGCVAVLSHTHVVTSEKVVTGKAAEVLAAANTAAEVALRVIRPRKKNKDVREAIQKAAAIYNCKMDFLTHQLTSNAFHVKAQDDLFEESEVYSIDIITSPVEGNEKSHSESGDMSARIQFTLLLMPNGCIRATTHPLQELQTSKCIPENSEVNAWLSLGAKTKKKKKTKDSDQRKNGTPQLPWEVFHIAGDGCCLFRAIAHGVFINKMNRMIPPENINAEEVYAGQLRSMVADALEESRSEMECSIEGNFDTYLHELRKPRTWGGQHEIIIAARVLKTRINVYKFAENELEFTFGSGDAIKGEVNLLYNGFTHYDLLVDTRIANASGSNTVDASS